MYNVCTYFTLMLYKECTTGYVICMYKIYSERKCTDADFMNALRRFQTIKLYIYIVWRHV